MFRTAALKLTGVFLLILMSLSLAASVAAYINASSRGNYFYNTYLPELQKNQKRQNSLDAEQFDTLMQEQYQSSLNSLVISLVFFNALIFFGGGTLSYVASRKVLGKIEQLYVARSQFASYASHAIRTPLANMLLDTEVTLSNDGVPKKELLRQLKSNLEEVYRLKSLSKTLLKLSSIDPSGLEFKRTDLSELTESAAERYDPDKHRIRLQLPKHPVMSKVNASSIDEVMAILLNNAYKYSYADTPIVIKLSQHKNKAVYSITSTGNPIPADKLKYIFDPYYRAENAYGGEGAGLGLAMAKEIILLHGGKINAFSHDENKTEFRFELPAKKH